MTSTDAGCDEQLVFVDKVSGAKSKRPGLDACMQELTDGDVLVVWRLDRLGRSMPHLISTIEELKARGVGFRSISDGVVDTTSPSGELVFNIFSALAHRIGRSLAMGIVQARGDGPPRLRL